MKDAFYKALIILSRRSGLWVMRFFTWWIATGYFVLFPKRLAVSLRFYRAVFPDKGIFHALCCSWQQYHNFSRNFLDRVKLFHDKDMTRNYTSEGFDLLEEAVNSKTGGVILMSHTGNWEVAAHRLKAKGRDNPRMKLLLYMGEKNKEQIEKTQKESLARSGVRIIAVGEDGGSPADILDGVQFLKEGGLVSLTADRVWQEKQRSVAVRFSGHEARLPEAPFIFALLSGSPLFIFFTFRTGKDTYHCQILPLDYVKVENRKERGAAIRKAAQAYAESLEEMVRQHPGEWFHFEQFIGKKIG